MSSAVAGDGSDEVADCHDSRQQPRLKSVPRGLASAESRGRGCSVRRDGYGRHRRRRRRRRGRRWAKRHAGTRHDDARAGSLVSDDNTNRSHGDYGAGTNDGR
jgi:hypothetical protein